MRKPHIILVKPNTKKAFDTIRKLYESKGWTVDKKKIDSRFLRAWPPVKGGSVCKPDIPLKNLPLGEKRSKDQYPTDVYRAIRILAVNPENVHPYGSYTFLAQPYAGDIDFYERFSLCPEGCTRAKAIEMVAEIIRKLFRRVHETPGVYFGDIKIGNDRIILKIFLQPHWGTIQGNSSDNGVNVISFQYEKVKNDIMFMHNNQLISDEDAKNLAQHISPNISVSSLIALKEVMRNIGILRWTYDEVMNGKKIINKVREITLEQAIDSCKQENGNFLSLNQISGYLSMVNISNLLI
jgi:hypothetical protein